MHQNNINSLTKATNPLTNPRPTMSTNALITNLLKIIENARCNTTDANSRIISAQGRTYILHLDTNHVYDLNKKHIGIFHPAIRRIEFLEDYEEEEDNHDELLMQTAMQLITPILIAEQAKQQAQQTQAQQTQARGARRARGRGRK